MGSRTLLSLVHHVELLHHNIIFHVGRFGSITTLLGDTKAHWRRAVFDHPPRLSLFRRHTKMARTHLGPKVKNLVKAYGLMKHIYKAHINQVCHTKQFITPERQSVMLYVSCTQSLTVRIRLIFYTLQDVENSALISCVTKIVILCTSRQNILLTGLWAMHQVLCDCLETLWAY